MILFCFFTEINGASPKKNDLTSSAVDLKEVLSVLNEVYGGSQNIDKEDGSFPLQEKILLCSLMLILNKAKNKDITLGKVKLDKNALSLSCDC